MPRGQTTRSATETRTRGRKEGSSKDDLSSCPAKRTKTTSPPKAVQKRKKKTDGTLSEGLDTENKSEVKEKILDKEAIQVEVLAERDDGKTSRKRKIENEAVEDIEANTLEDKSKSKSSKIASKKKKRSESSSEKDVCKDAECKVPVMSKNDGGQGMGLRKTRNTRQSGSFSSDGEREVEKKNIDDSQAVSEIDKPEGKTVKKNKSTKEAESYKSDGEKDDGQQHFPSDLKTCAMNSTRKTRNTRQNLSSDREIDLKHQDTTDASTDSELIPDEEKHMMQQNAIDKPSDKNVPQKSAGTRVTRYTRRTESISSDGERDVKQQNSTKSSVVKRFKQTLRGIHKTWNTRQTESSSSDPERDSKQPNASDPYEDIELVHVEKRIHKTQYAGQTESSSSDVERDSKLPNVSEPYEDSELIQVEKGIHRTRNTRRTESSSSDAERDNKLPYEDSELVQVKKGMRKTKNMRTKNWSSEMEIELEQHQINTNTDELKHGSLKHIRETRSSRRSGGNSSDKEKDNKQQKDQDAVPTDKDLKKKGKKVVENKIAIHSESFFSDIKYPSNIALNSGPENIVMEASNINTESLNDVKNTNVNSAKNEKYKLSSRTRGARRIGGSCSDRESDKTETDQNLHQDHEIKLNEKEKNDSDIEVNLNETIQSKQVFSDGTEENENNKNELFSGDENMITSNDADTDVELEGKNKKLGKFETKTRNAGKNNKGSDLPDVIHLSDEVDSFEDKKGAKGILVGRRTRNVRKLKGRTWSYPETQESSDLINITVSKNEEKSLVRRAGRNTKKQLNKVEQEIDLEDGHNKEFSNKKAVENEKKTDVILVKIINTKKSKNKAHQLVKNIKCKTRNATKNEKSLFMIGSNEVLQDDSENNTQTVNLETSSTETQTTHKTTSSKKIPMTRASKVFQGRDLDSYEADDAVLDSIIKGNDSLSFETVATVEGNEANLIPVNKESTLLTNKVKMSNTNDEKQSDEAFHTVRGKSHGRRVATLQVERKKNTRGIKKVSQDLIRNLKSSRTNQSTKKIDVSSDCFKSGFQMCKKVSVVIKKLDLYDPLIYKQLSDYDLKILKAGKESCEQLVVASNIECEDPTYKYSKKNELCEVPNDKETNSTTVFENEEQINLTIGPNEITKESSKIVNSKDTQLSTNSDIDSFSTNEITFENAEEKSTFESIVERYADENVNIGNLDTENTDFLTNELNCESFDLLKECNRSENSETDHNTTLEKTDKLKINSPLGQGNENMEVDDPENCSETSNLCLGTLVNKNDSLENLSTDGFSKNHDLQEPEIDDSNILDEALKESGISEIGGLLEIDDLDNNDSKREIENDFTDFKKSSDCEDDNENSMSLLESTCENTDEVERNEKFTKCLENSAESIFENENLPLVSTFTLLEVTEDSGAETFEFTTENFNSNPDTYEKNIKKSIEVCINPLDDKAMKSYVKNIKNTIAEKSLIEKVDYKENDSEILVNHQNDILNVVSTSVIIPNEGELKQGIDTTDQSMEESEKHNQIRLDTEFENLEKIDSNVIESIIENDNTIAENCLIENVDYKDDDSEILLNHQSDILNVVDTAVILPSEGELEERINTSDQSMDESEKHNQIRLDTEFENLEKMHSNVIENDGIGDSVASVEVGVDKAAYVKEDSMLDENEVDVDQTEHVKEDSIFVESMKNQSDLQSVEVCEETKCEQNNVENTEILEVCLEGYSCKLNPEVASDINENKTNKSLQCLFDSADVLKEVVKTVQDNNNFEHLFSDTTIESQSDDKAPINTSEEIKKNEVKADLFPEILSEIKNIEHEDNDRNVKEFVNTEVRGLGSNVTENELCCDENNQTMGTGTDFADNSLSEEEIPMVQTYINSSVPDKGKTDPKPLSEINGSGEKQSKGLGVMSSSGDQSQPGPSSINSQSKKSHMKSKNFFAKCTGLPRWPRMRDVPVRGYLEQFIPLLLEGLLKVNFVRPSDPIQYLAQLLMENKSEAYYRMRKNQQKHLKKRMVRKSDFRIDSL